MVGTRKASLYGMQQAKMLGYQLGRLGAIVVSGGADGIDTMCLTGALTAGRPVIAVLGCGVDVVYPAKNKGLFEDIRYHGCLISEYPPGTPAYSYNFPVRNRIMSGLALGVVVVEAPKRSGALITAARALEQGRDVFALPANVGSPTSEGNLQLLKEGATLISEGWDVMREYESLYPDRIPGAREKTVPMTLTAAETADVQHAKVAEGRSFPEKDDKKDIDKRENRDYIDVQEISDNLSPDEKAVIEQLTAGTLAMDEIIDRSQLPAARALAAITLLEVKGYLRRLPGKRFSLGCI